MCVRVLYLDPVLLVLLRAGLQLERALLARHLEGVRVILVGRLHHLHAVDADTRAHRKLLTHQTELGHAVQQEVVKLDKREEREKI